ncbi:MAG: hypothetical protein AAFR14_04780 [Bacteroidota bacterium]
MRYIIIMCLLTMSINVSYSQMSWEQHAGFGLYKYPNSIHASMRTYSGGINFWLDSTYTEGSILTSRFMELYDGNENCVFTKNNLRLTKNQGGSTVNRVNIDQNGINGVNGGSWPTYAIDGTTDGRLRLYNGSGRLNVYAGSAGTLNRGAVYIYGESSNRALAGMYIQSYGGTAQGVLFADVKNFKVQHPDDDEKEIWFASVEGPEVGAYDRGTAQLSSGETFVPFGEAYRLIANPSSMTVQVTPHSAETYGLAVISKTSDGFYVKELKDGNGNFTFDWEVKCVRRGHEDFEVIRPVLDPLSDEVKRTQKAEGTKPKLRGIISNPSPF